MIITKATSSRFKQKELINEANVTISYVTVDTIDGRAGVTIQAKNYTDDEKFEYFTVYLSDDEIERLYKMRQNKDNL